jgi:hypothetical protein
MMQYSREKFINSVLPRFFSQAKDIQCVENNYSTLLYHHLMLHGYSHRQVCREMLTQFDSGEPSHNFKRPDLSIFSPEINGRFNFTDRGVESNTPIKRKALRCLVEFKGSAWRGDSQALSDTSPKGELMKDITENLPLWRQLLNETADYFFFGINLVMPKGIWNDAKIERIAAECHENKVHFVYYMQGHDHFHVMEWDKKPQRTPHGMKTREVALVDA